MSDKEIKDEEIKTDEAIENEEESSEENVSEKDDSNEEAKSSKKDKKLKKDKKDEKIKELEARVKELEQSDLRWMAEFENFRKRSEKENTEKFAMGAKSIVEKILPVIDNFERGLATVPEEQKTEPFIEGMEKIYQQMVTELENVGVTAIEAIGKEFDPNLHNAVMQTQSDEYESGVVAQELQKGYMYRDTVVRHSMVAVVE